MPGATSTSIQSERLRSSPTFIGSSTLMEGTTEACKSFRLDALRGKGSRLWLLRLSGDRHRRKRTEAKAPSSTRGRRLDGSLVSLAALDRFYSGFGVRRYFNRRSSSRRLRLPEPRWKIRNRDWIRGDRCHLTAPSGAYPRFAGAEMPCRSPVDLFAMKAGHGRAQPRKTNDPRPLKLRQIKVSRLRKRRLEHSSLLLRCWCSRLTYCSPSTAGT